MSTVAIPISRGYTVIVDGPDAARVLACKWYAKPHRRTVYAVRNTRREDGAHTTQTLHKFLTGYAKTDHINGDGLDNRRENLREVTDGQNTRNTRRRLDNTSSFKGVCWNKQQGMWQARIAVDGVRYRLGYYTTAEEAARAYDAAARELHGEYATVNFPEHGERAA